ncbi:MAG TPA: DNA polymerase II large subunit [Candidatus Bathyarchaeia archaeon]|nr:DNA polymerase II large subunit [Candidatus Bathyarchaeia archaeon]
MINKMSIAYQNYVETMERQLSQLYALSDSARLKGLDPSLKTECILAQDIADLVEGLVGPKGVAASIRELNTKLGREEIAFKIAEQIVDGKFEHLEPEPAAEQAIRTALAIFTEGLTAAPIQGVAQVKIKTNLDNSRYLAIYFAGPIRSAGGTDQALTLVVGDFVRRLLGLDRYKPTAEEVSRFIEELRLYERSVGRFQYHIPDEELKKAFDYLPVEVTGTESDPIEVSSFRNLPRVETNRVRGGALRVVNDGIVGRALKVLTIIEKLGFQGWDWLREFKQKSEKKSAGFMDDVIAGRPIFSFPSRRGGFRLRYGRSRNSGLSAVGIHPATMLVLESFLAAGTQLRLELPGKGGVTVPVDSLEPPVVLLKDGSVVRVSLENFNDVKNNVAKILFLGDILISFGDFLYTSKALSPSGYVEEWWIKDVKKAIKEGFEGNFEKAAELAKVTPERLKSLIENPFSGDLTAKEAFALSLNLHLPLHPKFTYFWSNLSSVQDVKLMKNWLSNADVTQVDDSVYLIAGEMDQNVSLILRKIFAPHRIVEGKIVFEGENAFAMAMSLGYGSLRAIDDSSAESVLKAVSFLSGLDIKDKAPTFVGARMGRPEKAKRREMKPLVHFLFPVSLAGGSHRDLVEAGKKGPVFVDVVKRKCPNCKSYSFRVKCGDCGCETVAEKSCPRCGQLLKENRCSGCKADAVPYQRQSLNFKELLEVASRNLGVLAPKQLRGVKGLTNEDKTPEIIEKGILRARHDLSVYKDGTIRFDATNAPLTHIKPGEIGVPVEKLRQLGYTHDIFGVSLTEPNQILELKIQDVVVPRNAAEYFINVAAFLDELLTKVYHLPSFYNLRNPDELVGHLIMGLAPHTCASILGRVIGFTNLKVVYAHPVWHSAKRRDCDGDEDAIMLALDILLNFSRKFLPAQIGGIMDAPLLLIPFVNTKEVQRQAHDFDVDEAYSLEFYERTLERVEAKQLSPIMDVISHRLGTEAQFEGFHYTLPVSNINIGNSESSYKQLNSMIEKLNLQLALGARIDAVDVRRVALKVLTTHFMRDISGNLRAFSTQAFRCKSCNKRFRRLPLMGKCSFCGGKLTLTVYRGGIEKYLDAAQQLVDKYGLPKYYTQRLTLIKQEIASLFDNKKPKQSNLFDFA